ncbi:MAG: hypothetical protein WCJ17_00010 [bacterium]
MNRTLQNCLLFFSATFISSALSATISWELTDTGALGTDSTKTYAYTPASPINYEAFSGPLKCADTETSIEWIATIHATPYRDLGEFFWKAGDVEWSYNPLTREWGVINNTLVWFHSVDFDATNITHTKHTWSHNAKHDTWIFKPLDPLGEFSHYWQHTINRKSVGDTDYPFFSEKWGYNKSTNEWTNVTRNQVVQDNNWQFDQETMRWTRVGTNEVWECNPLLETFTLIGDGVARNRWRHLDKNIWLEEAEGIEWEYLQPEGDDQLSMWQSRVVKRNWIFDTETQQWITNTPGQPSRYFPPLVPPVFATQVEHIVDLYNELSAQVISPTVSSECILNDGIHTARFYSDNSFDLSIPALSASIGGGPHYGYTENFETSFGEKWHKESSLSPLDDTSYTNVSNTVTVRYKVAHNSSVGYWYITGTYFRWHYNPDTNLWLDTILGIEFTFDLDTLTWTNTATGTEWQYLFNHDLNAWVWRNTTAEEDWVLEEQTAATKGGGGTPKFPVWKNTSNNRRWYPFGRYDTELQTPIFLETTDELDFTNQHPWEYNPTDHLWYAADNLSGEGLELFPCVPGNLAGCIETLKKIGLADTTSTSPLSTALGIINRNTEAQSELADLATSLDTSIANATSPIALYDALLPQLPATKHFAEKNLLLWNEYTRLTNPLGETGSYFEPTIDVGFTSWNPTTWKFDTAGKGAITFELARPIGCKIGFAPEPTNDNSATYTLKIYLEQSSYASQEFPDDSDFTAYYTVYIVTLFKGETQLSEQGRPFIIIGKHYPDAQKIWCTYDNGHIKVGVGDPLTAVLKENGIALLFDYQLDDGDTPSSINYFSFADSYSWVGSVDINTFMTYHNTGPIHSIQVHNYDLFSTQVDAVDIANNCQDYVNLAPLELQWLHLKTELNALTTYGLTYRDKSELSEKLFGDLLARRTIAPPSGLSTRSQTYTDYVFSGLLFGTETLKVFTDYATQKLYRYDDSITALLTASTRPLSSDDKQELFDVASAAILEFILFAQNDAFTALNNDMDELSNTNKNDDFLPYKAFIKEENDILQNMSAGLEILGPPMLQRFFAEIPVTVGEPDLDPGLATLEELIAAEAQAKLDTMHALIQRIVDGISTPFSALTGMAMLFLIDSNFDNIRLTINDYLTAKGYTTFHLVSEPGSTLRNHTYLYTLFTQILKDLEPLLKTTGNTFAPPFQGDPNAPQLSSETIYVAQTVTPTNTTTVSDQQKNLDNGSSDYPKNTSVLTPTNAATRATIREILASDVPKTEVYSRIYIKDALIALGNGNFTKESRRALSLFGSADITPEGNCMITLNSDILISGPNFLHPSNSFGYDKNNATRCIPAIPASRRGHHEIIFYSPVERTITIASETELDLTAFAQGLVLNGQRITFAGKVKLVFEPNTRLRLPYTPQNKRDYCLTVAFKDEAELIFEGIENYDISSWTDALNGPDLVRSKILGCGVLEFSGHAQAKILKSALVGIEADYTSNITNIEIKLADSSKWLMGTSTISGGGLQVGNIQDGGSNNLDEDMYPNNTTHPRYGSLDDPFIPRTTQIDFSLTLAGTNAQFYIGRGAFVGFGAGTINKEGIINGTETTTPWSLQSLYNMGGISFNFLNGTFWHQNIAEGSSSDASLLAIGPQKGRSLYKLIMNKKKNTLIRGGGNVMFIRTNYTLPQEISVLHTIQPLIGDMTDSGKYSLLAPPPVIMLRQEIDADHPGYKKYGNAFILETPTTYLLSGPSDDFFRAITLQNLSNNGKYALAYNQESQNKFTLIDSAGIVLTSPIKLRQVKDQSNKRITPKNVTSEGIVRSNTTTARPLRLIKPKA